VVVVGHCAGPSSPNRQNRPSSEGTHVRAGGERRRSRHQGSSGSRRIEIPNLVGGRSGRAVRLTRTGRTPWPQACSVLRESTSRTKTCQSEM
jgi:hypothetical protein